MPADELGHRLHGPSGQVWFLFNGGPGAATVWLHMGAFGPKMVKLEPNGTATPIRRG